MQANSQNRIYAVSFFKVLWLVSYKRLFLLVFRLYKFAIKISRLYYRDICFLIHFQINVPSSESSCEIAYQASTLDQVELLVNLLARLKQIGMPIFAFKECLHCKQIKMNGSIDNNTKDNFGF